jgi:signal transduction histidine kinase
MCLQVNKAEAAAAAAAVTLQELAAEEQQLQQQEQRLSRELHAGKSKEQSLKKKVHSWLLQLRLTPPAAEVSLQQYLLCAQCGTG